jgi:formate dehydrogenase subunit gamma
MNDGIYRDDIHAHPERSIVRYRPVTRINHWLVAICFVLAALSGLAMFHPAMFWLSSLFGGGPWTRVLHPFIGVAMVVLFTGLAVKFWADNYLKDRDWEWLRKIRDVITNREDRLPEVGKYNAGQKLLFFTLVACLAGLLLTGVVIWRAYFSAFFPIEIIRLAALLHAACAFVLITSIIVHIYAALWIKGSVTAMTRGNVTPGWAWKHHRLWFREVTRSSRRG